MSTGRPGSICFLPGDGTSKAAVQAVSGPSPGGNHPSGLTVELAAVHRFAYTPTPQTLSQFISKCEWCGNQCRDVYVTERDDRKTTQVAKIHHPLLPFGIVKQGRDVTDCRQRPQPSQTGGYLSTIQEVHGRFTFNLVVLPADEWSAIAKVIFRNGQHSYDTDGDAQKKRGVH